MGKSRIYGTVPFLYEGRPLDEWLTSVVERVVARFDPLKVILFGALARGESRCDADVDLLVVFDEIEDEIQITAEILSALKDLPIAKDVVVATQDELDRHGDLVGTLFRPALKEGKILYEQA